MSSNTKFYNKLDKKVFASLISIIVMYVIFFIVTSYNLCENMEFYRNARHIGSIVKNIKDLEDGNRVIRVTYIVDKKTYNKDIEYNISELGDVGIGDTVSIFYNSNDPSEAQITTRTVGGVIFTVGILFVILVIIVLYTLYYYLKIKSNIKLIEDDNFVMAKFQRLEFRNSFNPFVAGKVNYVYCKTKINDEKVVFKSLGFIEKPIPLNDTSMIKVYMDKNDKRKYLVDLESIIEGK